MVKEAFDFVSIHYPFNQNTAIKIWRWDLYDKYIKYIQENSIYEAEVIMPSLSILNECDTLKYLKICPSIDAPEKYDFSPLYGRNIRYLHCTNRYGNGMKQIGVIDFSKIKGLESLSLEANRGTINYNLINTLKSLDIGAYKSLSGDISDLFCSKELDTLSIIGSSISSIKGIERSDKIKCVFLSRNRNLRDISALKLVKNSIRSLCIQYSPYLGDFTVLGELENLEKLEIRGIKNIHSLDFIENMKNLKTFIFDANIQDGDLTPCLNLQYVYTPYQRHHYNVNIKDLPKGIFAKGNESIEEWRRLE